MKPKYTFSRPLVLLTLAVLLTFISIPAMAASYNYDVTMGGVLTVNVGDTIYITNSHSTSGMVLSAFGWSSSDSNIVYIENGISSRSATLKAAGPGTVTIKGELTGAFQIENYGTRYNSATGKYEQYKYYTTQSYTYPYGCNITVNDTLAPQIIAQPENAYVAKNATASFTVTASDHSSMSYQWYYTDPGSSSAKKGGTTAAWSFTMNDSLNGRSVYCVITDQHGNTTKTDTVYARLFGISKQPSDVYVNAGGTVSTSVTAYGDDLKYVWYYKDAGSSWKKSSITTAKCSFKMSADKDEREIYCLITDKHGNQLQSKTVTVNIPESIVIVTQPKQAFAADGGSVTLSVQATGDELQYLWYYKDVGDSSFKASKLTGSSCTIAMTAAKSGRQVYCKITDRYGNTVNTKTVTVAVLAVTKQPSDSWGTTANTAVKAAGDGLTYVWYYRDAGTTTWKKSSITTAKCTFSMTAAKDEREIYCKITDKYGNSIKSKTVKVHYPEYAKITTQPKNTYAADGGTITLSLKATGDGLTYRWYYKDVGASSFKASNFTASSCSFAMSAAKSGRQIYCVVTDRYGKSVQSKTITIGRLEITKQPTDASGAKATTSVTAKGDGLTYVWYYKDVGDSSFTKSNITTAKCTVSMTPAKVGRQIYCKITDKYGNSIKSKTVTLSMLSITEQPKDAFGGNVSVSLKAAGDNLTYQWYYKDASMSDYAASDCTTDTYTCKMSGSNHLRKVYCVVTDARGDTVKSNTVTLYQLAITTQPKTSAIGTVTKDYTYSVTAVGEGLSYQWYWAQPDAQDKFVPHSANTSSFTHTITAQNSGCAFYCLITDKYGNSIKTNVVYGYLFNIDRTPTIYLSTLSPTVDKIKIYCESSCPMSRFVWSKYNPLTDSYTSISTSQLDGYTETETGCYFYIDRNSISAGDAYQCYYYNNWNCYSAFIVYIRK